MRRDVDAEASGWGRTAHSEPVLEESNPDLGRGAAAPPRIDRVVQSGRYERVSVLGRGGMGTVWLGWDRLLRRNVALKTPLGGPGSGAAQALRREATLAARLEHPGIVTVHDVEEDPEGPAFVMALVRGRTLDQLLAEAGDDGERRSRLLAPFAQACLAVGHAHERDLVHRDLSPRNLLLGDDGAVRVVDWGLAHDLRSEGLSPPRAGTPGFVSPQQAAGAPPHPTDDVYSLGCVLHRILYGVRAEHHAAPNPELAAVVAKARAASPDQRYADAGALAAELERWLQGRRVEAYDFPTWKLAWRVIRRWRLPLALALVGLVGVGLSLGWGIREAEREAEQARSAEARARDARDRAQRALARALAEQAVSALERGYVQRAEALAREALARGPAARARGVLALAGGLAAPELLQQHALPDCPQWVATGRADRAICRETHRLWAFDGEGEAWSIDVPYYELRVVGDRLFAPSTRDRMDRVDIETGAWTAHDPRPGVMVDALHAARFRREDGAALEPGWPTIPCQSWPWAVLPLRDGRFAFACGDEGVAFAEAEAGIAAAAPAPPAPRSPGGGARALVEDHAGRLWVGTNTGRVVQLDQPTAGLALAEPVRGLWALPHDRLLVQGIAGALLVFDVATNATLYHLPPSHFPAWVGADGLIEAAGHDGVWRRWRLPEASPRRAVYLPAGFSAVDWMPGQDLVMAADGGGRLTSFRPLAGGALHVRPWLPGVAKAVSGDPRTGRFVSTGMHAGGAWAVEPLADAPPERLFEADPSGRRVLAMADGALVYAGFRPGVWVLAPGAAAPRVLLASHMVHDLDASPDRRRAVLVGDGVWTLRFEGAEPEPLPVLLPRLRPPGLRGTRGLSDWVAGAIDDRGELLLVHGERLELWSPRGALRRAWPHPYAPMDCAFVPASPLLATASTDGAIRLWHRERAELVAELPAHTSRAAALAFSADGRHLISAGWDGLLRVSALAPVLAPVLAPHLALAPLARPGPAPR